MDHYRNLFDAIQAELVNAKLQHVQALLSFENGFYCIKFVSVDSDKRRDRLKATTDRYCESMSLVRETKTVRVFAI